MLNKPIKPIIKSVFGIGLLFVMIGCQPAINEMNIQTVTQIASAGQSEEQPPATTPISSHITPLATITPTSSATAPATLKPTQPKLPTGTATAVPILIETPTPTSWPTLPPDEAANSVLNLYQTPDCLLPCWWDTTPGQTNWQDIAPFLKSIATNIRETSLGASVTLPLPESMAVAGFDFNIVYIWDELEVINEIEIDSINVAGYDPKTIMTIYGSPDEVWVTTIDEPREGVLPFQLILVYQQQGISLRYYTDATKTGETITVCFEPGVVELERPDLFPVGPIIYLWEPGETKTIKEIAPIPLERYFLLEDKTDLSPQLLHEKFTNSDEQPCIDTPASAWPY